MNEMVERMSDSLDYQVIRAQSALRKQKEKAQEVLRSEAGAVDIVVILLLVVVAIALVALFRQQLSDLITQVFQKLKDAVTGASGDLEATPQ